MAHRRRHGGLRTVVVLRLAGHASHRRDPHGHPADAPDNAPDPLPSARGPGRLVPGDRRRGPDRVPYRAAGRVHRFLRHLVPVLPGARPGVVAGETGPQNGRDEARGTGTARHDPPLAAGHRCHPGTDLLDQVVGALPRRGRRHRRRHLGHPGAAAGGGTSLVPGGHGRPGRERLLSDGSGRGCGLRRVLVVLVHPPPCLQARVDGGAARAGRAGPSPLAVQLCRRLAVPEDQRLRRLPPADVRVPRGSGLATHLPVEALRLAAADPADLLLLGGQDAGAADLLGRRLRPGDHLDREHRHLVVGGGGAGGRRHHRAEEP